IADVERIDIRDDLASVFEPVKLELEPFGLFLGAAGACVFDRLVQRVQLPRFGPPQRDPPRHAVPHGPPNAEVGRAAGNLVTGTWPGEREGFLEALLYEVGKLTILEKHVEELFLCHCKLESIRTRAVRASLRAAASFAARRPRNLVAFHISLVPGLDMLGT